MVPYECVYYIALRKQVEHLTYIYILHSLNQRRALGALKPGFQCIPREMAQNSTAVELLSYLPLVVSTRVY